MKKITGFFFFSIMLFTTVAQKNISIIPQPQMVMAGKGNCKISPSAIIFSNNELLLKQADFFNEYLNLQCGFSLKTASKASPGATTISLELKNIKDWKPGSYQMEVAANGIKIVGYDAAGIFYGLNNLLQMMEVNHKETEKSVSIPFCKIMDAPRFEYRGMMLDVARHFRSKAYIMKLLDQMAMLKLNVFHWHLTEDQGWRIEIKKYPKLTEVGAFRDGTIIGHYPGTGNDNLKHGGFYSQEEVKEIVKYAAERNITVVPEIEMPGHSGAAIAAYPWLSCFPEEETIIPKFPSAGSMAKKGKKVQESWGVYEDVFVPSEQTFQFLQDVIDEIIPLFPGKFIHIGGDECPKEAWKKSDFCQQLIKDKGLKDEHGLQSYFIQRMEKYINSKGKQIIGWDEILEGGLAPNATVMSWRGEQGGIEAAKQNHNVIMSPTTFVYFDYSQTKNEDSVVIGGYLPLEKVYSYNPMPEQLQGTSFEKYVQGAQANVWSEYIKSDSKLEYMIFPRLAALSESVWTNPTEKNWSRFENNLLSYFNRLEKLGVNYSKAFYELKAAILPNAKQDGVNWELNTKMPGGEISFATPASTDYRPYKQSIPVVNSGMYKAKIVLNKKVAYELEQQFSLHKAVGRSLVLKEPSSRKYPGNGGDFGLVNGAISSNGLQSPEWFGWEGGDMEAIIDLGKLEEIKEVNVYTMESRGSWIYQPKMAIIEVSDDNKTFSPVGKYESNSSGNEKAAIRKITIPIQNISVNQAVKTRYIKIKVQNFGEIPTGLPGAGHKAWLFVDEIEVN